jgi:two-component sensor histidine kinase
VDWSLVSGNEGKKSLKLYWAETGGPPVRVPERKSFGTRFIERSISFELGGNVDLTFERSGVKLSANVPLPV